MAGSTNSLLGKWGYILILGFFLLSTVVNVFLIGGFLWKNYSFSSDFEPVITTILAVLGVFITFSAINIYSLFNVQITKERYGLEALRELCHTEITEMEKLCKNLNVRDNDSEASIQNIILTFYVLDIVNKNISIVDRTTTISKFIGMIETKENEMRCNNLKDKEIELRNTLNSLKKRIKERLSPYYTELDKESNTVFKQVYSKLKEKLETI
ncbi:MAG: hypothetical protein LBL58_12675 [Tannerellaceae bacterium]|jgi:hypothetical protein|nr:hypothetical protein [Tannerellaceae bacterium]